VLASEWIKLRTLRSTWYLVVAILAAITVFGLIASATAAGDVANTSVGSHDPMFGGGGDPVRTVLIGANFAILIVAVMGALAGAREYASGLIRATLAAVPARLPVLWAKVLVFTAIIVPVVVVGVLVAFFTGMQLLSGGDVGSASWSDPGVSRAVLGTAAYMAGIGLIGVALGILFRSIAASIATLVGGILFLPTLATALLPSSWDFLLKYLPSNAGTSFTSVDAGTSLLSPTAGALVFAGWVAIAIVGAAVMLKRRDA
jgi:ABC-type transport system involved in multi-copper enzyme maturation permease subunit